MTSGIKKYLLAATAFVFLSMSYASAEVLTWNCNFDYRIDADGKADEKMQLLFKIDTVSKKAIMEGNVGLVDVTVHIGDNGFTLARPLVSGAVQTTTVLGNGQAVHS